MKIPLDFSCTRRIISRMEQKKVRDDLRKRRERMKVPRGDLAVMIGVREATLYRWECGGIAKIPKRSMCDWVRAIEEAKQKRA